MSSSSTAASAASPPEGSLVQFVATWHIPGFMLTSLLIQISLTFLAPHRKRLTSGFFAFMMWLLYLSADSIALTTIALIARTDTTSDSQDLLSFWGPFLLLHLGGPDTITALALEDNELWLRHALQLATQLGVTLYVFVHSFHRNDLRVPTILMLVNGCIKYGERICALYYASTDVFKESIGAKPEPGPNYSRLMEEYVGAKTANIPVTILSQSAYQAKAREVRMNIEGDTRPSTPDTYELVKEAYHLYDKFKGFIVGAFLTFKDRKASRDSFLKKHWQEMYRIVEIELSLIYGVFYTKAILSLKRHLLLRVISLLLAIVCFWLFFKDMRKYDNIRDVRVTLALAACAVGLDLWALCSLLFSDWCVVISDVHQWKCVRWLFLKLWKPGSRAKYQFQGKWSRSISQYNLLIRFFKKPPCFYNLLVVKRFKDALVGWLYVNNVKLDDKLIKFIVDELKMKARLVPNDSEPGGIKEACSARGNLVLQDRYKLVSGYLSPWTVDVEYDESLLTWHLATDICYFATNTSEAEYRQISKTLSDYMSYILLVRPGMVSQVAGMSEIRFEDTNANANNLESKHKLKPWPWHFVAFLLWLLLFLVVMLRQCRLDREMREIIKKEFDREDEKIISEFCKNMLDGNAHVPGIVIKGDKSKSVLIDAGRLAQQLMMLGDKQWEITSKVWLELLCYAAIRCPPRSHVERLSHGGELITTVWLLMTHLGLSERFLPNREFGWAKLVIPE